MIQNLAATTKRFTATLGLVALFGVNTQLLQAEDLQSDRSNSFSGSVKIVVIMDETGEGVFGMGFILKLRKVEEGYGKVSYQETAVTNERGIAEFSAVPPGVYRIATPIENRKEFFAKGKKLHQYTFPALTKHFHVQPDQALEINMIAKRGAVLKGRVVDTSRDQPFGGTIFAPGANPGAVLRRWDPEGRFEIRGLDPDQDGSFYVKPNGYPCRLRMRVKQSDLVAGKVYTLPDIDLAPLAGNARIRLKVRDEVGTLVSETVGRVYFQSEDASVEGYVLVTDGVCEIGLPPGVYEFGDEVAHAPLDSVAKGRKSKIAKCTVTNRAGEVNVVEAQLIRLAVESPEASAGDLKPKKPEDKRRNRKFRRRRSSPSPAPGSTNQP